MCVCLIRDDDVYALLEYTTHTHRMHITVDSIKYKNQIDIAVYFVLAKVKPFTEIVFKETATVNTRSAAKRPNINLKIGIISSIRPRGLFLKTKSVIYC